MTKLIKRAWAWLYHNWLAPQSWSDEWVEYKRDGRCVYRGFLREMPADIRREQEAFDAEVAARMEAAYKEMDAAFTDEEVHSCRSSSHSQSS